MRLMLTERTVDGDFFIGIDGRVKGTRNQRNKGGQAQGSEVGDRYTTDGVKNATFQIGNVAFLIGNEVIEAQNETF